MGSLGSAVMDSLGRDASPVKVTSRARSTSVCTRSRASPPSPPSPPLMPPPPSAPTAAPSCARILASTADPSGSSAGSTSPSAVSSQLCDPARESTTHRRSAARLASRTVLTHERKPSASSRPAPRAKAARASTARLRATWPLHASQATAARRFTKCASARRCCVRRASALPRASRRHASKVTTRKRLRSRLPARARSWRLTLERMA